VSIKLVVPVRHTLDHLHDAFIKISGVVTCVEFVKYIQNWFTMSAKVDRAQLITSIYVRK